MLSFAKRTGMVLAAISLLMTNIPPADAQDETRALQPSDQNSLFANIQALQKQTSEIYALLDGMKAELIRARTEAAELRRELEITREQLNPAASGKKDSSTSLAAPVESQNSQGAVEALDDDHRLLRAKIDEQYQTKVESASKYRVRFSGAVLMNLFSTKGAVDNLDFPNFVLADGPSYSRGSFAASVRQSLLGFEVFGPEIKGKRVQADVQFDFAGGFPNAPNGLTFPLPRLRTAMVRLSSSETTIAAGQDAPFFSPISPASVASIAVPPFAYSGQLWGWIPQVRVERRLSLRNDSDLVFQGGIMDGLSGEAPASQFVRTPQAGEASRQPA